ncbi:MAG: bifunctional acetaldehyde-CoA/alcohol dehydrogenase [Bacteroidetes bacterium]|nr:bifunctional acetaldehyde-CoA/alcohol dehydrogenase [Bacteroidota bacterium]
MKENTKGVAQESGETKKEETKKVVLQEVKPGFSTDIQELEDLISRVHDAQKIYRTYSQEQVDEIFRKAAFAAAGSRIKLAKMAVAETGMGVVEDKVIKNHFASEFIYNKYKDEKTCGIIEEDLSAGIRKIAEPIGVIAGIVPTTNPTSTAIFKALISLKTRNGIIFSPHPRAAKSTIAAAKIILDAAVEAGAPKDIISWIEVPTIEKSQHLMHHKGISLILATGGPGMVKAAYSSGVPAIGVGAGNTPAIIDETAHLKMAVNSVLMSKTFDNGMICASEQSVVVVEEVYDAVRQEFAESGGYFLNADEKDKVGKLMIVDGHVNAKVVGQYAWKIAEMAGFSVPKTTKVLIGEAERIADDEPFSYEKLSPILAMYKAKNFQDAELKAIKLVQFGGIGHTSVLYTDLRNTDRIESFSSLLKTGRLLVNMPASQGAIGDIYNFKLDPSLTLGCGSWGGNSVSENVGVKHLLNIKTNAERRENMLWLQIPPKIYFKYGCLPVALTDLAGRKRAFIITDKPIYDLGYTEKVTRELKKMNIDFSIFYEVEPDPTLANVKKGLSSMNAFQPDVIISLGGGSAMDCAKIMWLMYEYPDTQFEGLALRFMDIRKRIYQFPALGRKAYMVAIPTTSGTGSEVTPFAVVTDEKTGIKYPIADYQLTPNMAIVDPEFVLTMPTKLTAWSGVDALTHALEAMVSVFATEFTIPYSLEAGRILFKYLPTSYREGAKNLKAKEKVHYASTMAGIAFANAFLGVCHSMAHKLGSEFHIPHGLANALIISHVIRFNATNTPRKQATFPQYKYPLAIERYARFATYCGFEGNTPEDLVESLIAGIEKLKAEVNIPKSIREAGVEASEFYARLDDLAELAFDDQCTGTNPRYPSIEEIKELYIKAYEGK